MKKGGPVRSEDSKEFLEIFDAISARWPRRRGEGAGREIFALVDRALKTFPYSAKLWWIRGNLLKISDIPNHKFEDCLACYRKAIQLNPHCAEAYEEMGFYYDIKGYYKCALQAFRKAVRLGGGGDAYYGLARVLAQMGRGKEALRIIDTSPYRMEKEICVLRREIKEGLWAP